MTMQRVRENRRNDFHFADLRRRRTMPTSRMSQSIRTFFLAFLNFMTYRVFVTQFDPSRPRQTPNQPIRRPRRNRHTFRQRHFSILQIRRRKIGSKIRRLRNFYIHFIT